MDFTELKYINDEITIPCEKLVKKNTLLMCMANGSKQHLGKVALIDSEYGYAFGGFMGLLIPKNIYPKYLYYSLIAPQFTFLIQHLTDGTNINNLKFSDIKEYEFSLPALPDQQEIVARLEKELVKVDEMAESFKRMAELADEEFQSVLAETFEHVEGKSVQLGDVCDIKAGGDKPFPFSTTLNDSYNIPVIANAIEKDGLCGYTDKPTIVQKCITVSARGTIGYTCVRDYPFVPIIRLLVVTPRKDIDVQYLCYFLQTQKINSTGVSIPQLTAPMLRQIKYIDVEKGQQEIIVKKINNAKVHHDILYDNAKKCLSLCSELRKSILQEAFS